MSDILARAFRWGLLGLLIGPAAVYSVMLLVLYFDPSCRAVVIENCRLDAVINLTLGVIVGFLAFFLISLLSGLAKRARDAVD